MRNAVPVEVGSYHRRQRPRAVGAAAFSPVMTSGWKHPGSPNANGALGVPRPRSILTGGRAHFHADRRHDHAWATPGGLAPGIADRREVLDLGKGRVERQELLADAFH